MSDNKENELPPENELPNLRIPIPDIVKDITLTPVGDTEDYGNLAFMIEDLTNFLWEKHSIPPQTTFEDWWQNETNRHVWDWHYEEANENEIHYYPPFTLFLRMRDMCQDKLDQHEALLRLTELSKEARDVPNEPCDISSNSSQTSSEKSNEEDEC